MWIGLFCYLEHGMRGFLMGMGRYRKNAEGEIRHGMQSVWQEACPPAAAVFAYIRGQMLDKMDNK